MKKLYAVRMLIIGLISLASGIYMIPRSIVFRSQLTELKGTLSAENILVKTVNSGRKSSQTSTLSFYLNEYKKKFVLVENVGNSWASLDHQRIERDLRVARDIIVSIKQSELDEYQPRVFEIRSDEKIILDFEEVKDQSRYLMAFFIAMGIGAIIAWYYFRKPAAG